MRLARKLFLLTMAAVAAMAFAASAASANSDIEVLDEDTLGQPHCPQVFLSGDHGVTGGCEVHATSEGTANLAVHNGMAEGVFSLCNNEFDARINESGSGWIFNQILSGVNCGLEACDEASPEHTQIPWPVRLDEIAANVINLRTAFCVRSVLDPEGSAGTLCVVDVAVTNPSEHNYTFTAVDSPCLNNPVIELTGTWHTEDDGSEAEITHL